MREAILSKCEKTFVLQAISELKRLDGREFDEYRELDIHFGIDWGCCQVSLGQTKVLAQVSCDVQQPKATRPNEGLLLVTVELSPMGAPHFEAGRQSDLAVQLTRLLEKTIKDSRCVDLESLCIVADEKVWVLRVDVNVLNHEGALVDAASVAALAALGHFRRPDVTTTGEQTVIHSAAERDPLPISLHHHPVCTSFAVFNMGQHVVADPTELEERVSEAQLVLSVNAFRELCGLHLGGNALASSNVVLQCSNRAAKRAAIVVQQIKDALARDEQDRVAEKVPGFVACMHDLSGLSIRTEHLPICLDSRGLRQKAAKVVKGESSSTDIDTVDESQSEDSIMEVDSEGEPVVVSLGKGSAQFVPPIVTRIGEGGPSKWLEESSSDEEEVLVEDEEEDEDSEVEVVEEVKGKILDSIELSGDSEEDETLILQSPEIVVIRETLNPAKKLKKNGPKKKERVVGKEKKNVRGWYPKSQW